MRRLRRCLSYGPSWKTASPAAMGAINAVLLYLAYLMIDRGYKLKA